jgi:hypothetical protein
MKIAFHSMQLGYRGTEITMFDYAFYNQKLLGHESIIISPSTRNLHAKSKFDEHFNVFLYDDPINYDRKDVAARRSITEICEREKVDALYVIKGGEIDGFQSDACKNLIQCVFRSDEPHGDVYSVQCDYMNLKHGTNWPVVPCMVHLPESSESLRDDLGIPQEAFVFGRHGGVETWWDGGPSKWVYQVIEHALNIRSDLWFVFMNTPRFTMHERALFLDPSVDLLHKSKFVNTCDAMIHSRVDGETFGLSVAEFSIKNKPVVTNPVHCGDKAHIMMLGEKCLHYSDPQQLAHILLGISKDFVRSKNWDAYSHFCNPEYVMKQFKTHYLEHK